MPKPAVSRPILSKTVFTTSTVATATPMAFLILMTSALPGCKKNRSEAALEILPDPQANSRTQAPTNIPHPPDTAPNPNRNDSTALEFVSNLYRNYGVNSSFTPLDQGADTVFAPELLGLIREDSKQAQGEAGYLDGDPLCDCQDFDITDVRITLRKSTPNRLNAEVRFLNFDRPDTLGLSLLQSDKTWRIEDIRTKSSASLRNDLRTYLSQAQAKPDP